MSIGHTVLRLNKVDIHIQKSPISFKLLKGPPELSPDLVIYWHMSRPWLYIMFLYPLVIFLHWIVRFVVFRYFTLLWAFKLITCKGISRSTVAHLNSNGACGFHDTTSHEIRHRGCIWFLLQHKSRTRNNNSIRHNEIPCI